MPEDIEITTTNRGFHVYGPPLICTYGNTAHVYESSSAAGPRVWLKVTTGPQLKAELGEAVLHLNMEQARGLIERLQAWLAEFPERWADDECWQAGAREQEQEER